jgi:hypothetical protein
MSARVEWTGVQRIKQGMQTYEQKVRGAIVAVAQYWAAVFEKYAKEEAPWTDRTANARQSLHAWIEELSNDTVELWLSHGMEYGVFLETRFAGRYQIIWPTIEAHLSEIHKMLKGIFG